MYRTVYMSLMPSRLPAKADTGPDFGPAMTALLPKYRAFVLAYCTTAGAVGTEAARQAGYSHQEAQALRVTASRLMHKPTVLAAIREVCMQNIASDAPVMVEALKRVALNQQHKDQVKALGMLLNRGGLPDVTEKNINVNVTMSNQQKIAEITQFAEEMGLDPKTLLGNVTDVDFEEVKK